MTKTTLELKPGDEFTIRYRYVGEQYGTRHKVACVKDPFKGEIFIYHSMLELAENIKRFCPEIKMGLKFQHNSEVGEVVYVEGINAVVRWTEEGLLQELEIWDKDRLKDEINSNYFEVIQ